MHDEPTDVLDGKFVVLGVTGGIAAYKAVDVCRRLVDAGAHVAPVLTAGAQKFVGRATFAALASEPPQSTLFEESSPIPHTRLGQSADLIVVAPATAKLLSAYASGYSDDLLTATLLATRAPVLLAPAMHTEMWEHPAVRDNLEVLRSRGVNFVGPDSGRLAGGDSGAGRLAEPEDIVSVCRTLLSPGDLAGVRIVITAGGTREPIDPVRVIANRSTGKQGYALAEAAVDRGAIVTLVTTVDRPLARGVETVQVETAEQMQDAVMPLARDADVVIMAAAVADFRPKVTADRKVKKSEGMAEIVLEPTHDFLVDLAREKPDGQILVGFAAETEDLVENAAQKMRTKMLDLIVANDVSAPGAGFAHDTNEVVILTAAGDAAAVPLTSKRRVADAILDRVKQLRHP